MSEHQSKLTFSIEESIWLNKGQEIATVLGMSLEPEIVIEEDGDEVYIKGGLRLIGRYEGLESDEEDSQNEIQTSLRPMGEVRTNEDGTKEISYFLPIDISIPSSRIQNLDDVFVEVESFDYDLPERSCIQLTADISITGMAHPEQSAPLEREKKLDVHTASFSFDAKKMASEEVSQRDNDQGKSETIKEGVVQEQSANEEVKLKDEVEEVEEVEAVRGSDEEATKREKVETKSAVAESEEDVAFVEEEEEEEQEERTLVTVGAKRESAQEESVEEESEEGGEEESEEPSSRNDNTLYLTKMMANEEEQFVTLKMCIIQENESLDMIAERYDVSTSQLVRVNRLEGEYVEEGQILYIPVPTKQR